MDDRAVCQSSFALTVNRLSFGDRDSIGDCVVAGDLRWAGTFGVNVDFVARSHCSVALITIDDIQVMVCSNSQEGGLALV